MPHVIGQENRFIRSASPKSYSLCLNYLPFQMCASIRSFYLVQIWNLVKLWSPVTERTLLTRETFSQQGSIGGKN
jgi:hypothetical protein